MKKETKQKLIFAAVAIVVIGAIVGFIYGSSVLKKQEIDLDSHLKIIDFKELQEKVNNKETFILLFSQTDCVHCAAFKPIFKEVLTKHDLTAYEIQLDTLTDDEKNQLYTIANVSGTPTTVFIENGAEKSTSTRLQGEATADKIEARLKAVGYIE